VYREFCYGCIIRIMRDSLRYEVVHYFQRRSSRSVAVETEESYSHMGNNQILIDEIVK